MDSIFAAWVDICVWTGWAWPKEAVSVQASVAAACDVFSGPFVSALHSRKEMQDEQTDCDWVIGLFR